MLASLSLYLSFVKGPPLTPVFVSRKGIPVAKEVAGTYAPLKEIVVLNY